MAKMTQSSVMAENLVNWKRINEKLAKGSQEEISM
jgi:hypothetical protein